MGDKGRAMSLRFIFLALIASSFGLAGCFTKTDPLACKNGLCDHQSERTFCDIEGAFPGTELKNECIEPPSGSPCNSVEECSDNNLHCTSDSMGSCEECVTLSHCNEAQGEICDADNKCTVLTCTDEPGTMSDVCAMANSNRPFCSDGGICVECGSSVDCSQPADSVCDPVDFSCRGCEAHSECEDSKACDMDTGMCEAESSIIYVAKDGVDEAECGGATDECLTIEQALTEVKPDKRIIVVREGFYPEAIQTSILNVSIIADGEVTLNPVLYETMAPNFAIGITGSANVEIHGITIKASSADPYRPTVNCSNSSATLALFDSTVDEAEGEGVIAQACNLRLERSTITNGGGTGVLAKNGAQLTVLASTISGNDAGGVDVLESAFTIVNSFVIANGDGSSAFGGIRVNNLMEQDQVLDFNTIAGNQKSPASELAVDLQCTTNKKLIASSNIVYGGFAGTSDTVPNLGANENCELIYSNIEGDPTTEETNIDANPKFQDENSWKYQILTGSPCIDAAEPGSSVLTDYEGDLRNQGEGNDIGADEVE